MCVCVCGGGGGWGGQGGGGWGWLGKQEKDYMSYPTLLILTVTKKMYYLECTQHQHLHYENSCFFPFPGGHIL